MPLALREITMDNFHDCLNLQLDDVQKNYVASNMYSLAEAKADGVSVPLAIYDGETMVGFIMYDYNHAERIGYITRLMVDCRHQRKGYGRYAMRQVIERLREYSDRRYIQTSYWPQNTAAGRLYESLGFIKNGEVSEGEIVCILKD